MGEPMRAILFANPGSGRSQQWIFRVVEQCRRHEIELVSTHFDLDPRAIESALRTAASENVEVVLAAGGDGTIGTVAGALANTDFSLGVLPAGTSNDFARSLGIPLTPDGALSVVASGHATRIDLGQVGERFFCHAATVGINTEFAMVAQRLRRYLHRLAYPIAAAAVYLRRKRFEFKIERDGQVERYEPFQVALVNAPVYGGPLDLHVPQSQLNDRRLQMIVVGDIKPGTIVSALPRLLQRRPPAFPGIETEPLISARIITQPPMRVTLDGEMGEPTPVDIRIVPGALRVFVPRDFGDRPRGTAV